MFYDYVDAGSWTESTYRANESDFQQIKFRQRVAINMEHRRIASTMLGQPVTMPVALSPVGMTGMQYADGEILAARAANRFGVPFCLSTMSICSIEEIAKHTQTPFWFQLYVMRDKAFVKALIERAKMARDTGADALFVEAPESAADMEAIATALPDITLVANMVEKGKTPLLTPAELAALGFRLVVSPLSLLLASTQAMTRAAQQLSESGTLRDHLSEIAPFDIFNDLVGLPEHIAGEKGYRQP